MTKIEPVAAANIAVLILAAGRGRRYGIPKIRAEIGGFFFADRILDCCTKCGLAEIFLIVHPREADFAASNFKRAKIVVNPAPDSEMLDSVKIGLQKIQNQSAILLWPVDFPLIKPETLGQLLKIRQEKKDRIVKPLYQNQGGHPLLLPAGLISSILTAPADSNLREIVRQHHHLLQTVPVDDVGVVRNLNFAEGGE